MPKGYPERDRSVELGIGSHAAMGLAMLPELKMVARSQASLNDGLASQIQQPAEVSKEALDDMVPILKTSVQLYTRYGAVNIANGVAEKAINLARELHASQPTVPPTP
jgi:hypothetical protein